MDTKKYVWKSADIIKMHHKTDFNIDCHKICFE